MANPVKETPSKAAANALSDLELKDSKANLIKQLETVKEAAAADAEETEARLSRAAIEHRNFLKSHAVHRHQLKEVEREEPLLVENKRRFVLFPIKYHEIWQAYKLSLIHI